MLIKRETELSEIIITENMREKKALAANLIIEMLFSDLDFAWVGNRTGFFARRENNVYKHPAFSEIRESIRRILRRVSIPESEHFINEILSKFKDTYYFPINDFIPDENLVVCNNGILDFDNFEILYTDSINIKTFNKIPHDIDENADCPKFRAFLRSIFKDHDDPIKSEQLVFEMIGYLIQYKINFQKAFILTSREGGTGKSSVINIILELIGFNNTAKVPLQRIATNQFALAPAKFKLLLYFTDLPVRLRINDTGLIKDLISDREIIIEQKGKDVVYQRNILKLLFSANGLLRLSIVDSAWARRWVIIDLNNVIENPEEDWEYKHVINDEQEMNGILINSFYAYQCLVERGGFEGQSTEEVRERWLIETDDVYRFIKEKCRKGVDLFIEKEKLYQAYAEWCNSQTSVAEALDLNKFTRRIKKFGITISRKVINEHRVYCYQGIDLNTYRAMHFDDKTKKKSKSLLDFDDEEIQDLIDEFM